MRYYEEELETLIKAGAKVVEVASFEWERVHGFANYVAEDLNVDWYAWSAVSGLKVWDNGNFKTINPDCVTLPAVLDYYLKAEDDMLLVLEDFHPYSEVNNPANVRYLREMMRAQSYSGNYKKAIILSSPNKFVPEELSKELPVIEVDLPDRDTIEVIANSVVEEYSEYCMESEITPKLLESALGLTVMEARLAFAKAIIQNRKLTEEENRKEDKTVRVHIQGGRKREKLNRQGNKIKRINNDGLCNSDNNGQAHNRHRPRKRNVKRVEAAGE